MLGALWTFPGVGVVTVDALGAHAFNALAGFALASALLVCGLLYGPPASPGKIDLLSTFALSVYLVVASILVLASRHDDVALAAFVVLTVAAVAIAWRTEAAAGAVPVAAILAAVVMAHWAVQMNVQGLLAPSGPTAPAVPEPERFFYGSHLLLAAAWAAMFGVAGFLAQGRSVRAFVPMLWCAAAVFAPLAMLIALYYRIAALDRSLPFAALALLLAAIYGVATETLVRREERPGLMASSAMFATGALAALALALTFALEKGWLTVGLALMVSGRRLGRREAAAAVAALARGDHRRRGGGARRLSAGHRRRRSRRDADLQLAALWLRHPGGGILARGMAVTPARR